MVNEDNVQRILRDLHILYDDPGYNPRRLWIAYGLGIRIYPKDDMREAYRRRREEKD